MDQFGFLVVLLPFVFFLFRFLSFVLFCKLVCYRSFHSFLLISIFHFVSHFSCALPRSLFLFNFYYIVFSRSSISFSFVRCCCFFLRFPVHFLIRSFSIVFPYSFLLVRLFPFILFIRYFSRVRFLFILIQSS